MLAVASLIYNEEHWLICNFETSIKYLLTTKYFLNSLQYITRILCKQFLYAKLKDILVVINLNVNQKSAPYLLESQTLDTIFVIYF